MVTVLIIYCCVKNCLQLTGLKRQTCIIFTVSVGQQSWHWVLYSESVKRPESRCLRSYQCYGHLQIQSQVFVAATVTSVVPVVRLCLLKEVSQPFKTASLAGTKCSNISPCWGTFTIQTRTRWHAFSFLRATCLLSSSESVANAALVFVDVFYS